MDSAQLLSLNALTDLDDALGHFGSRAKECLQAAESSLRRQLAQLAVRREDAERQVRVCATHLAEASADEKAEAAWLLRVAEERLSLIRRWQGRAEEACQRYQGVARQFEGTANEHIPRAQSNLRTKHDEAAAYLAAQMEGDVPVTQRAPAPPPSQAASATSEAARLDSIVQFPLPPGFRWVSLEHISRHDNLAGDEGFDKVSENEMRRGLGTLRRQVLPYLANHPNANSLTFLELDGWTAEGGPKSRQKVYDAFFGDEPIVLDGPYPDGTFGITNGRHRIKVARDLGWTAVPVKVTGER